MLTINDGLLFPAAEYLHDKVVSKALCGKVCSFYISCITIVVNIDIILIVVDISIVIAVIITTVYNNDIVVGYSDSVTLLLLSFIYIFNVNISKLHCFILKRLSIEHVLADIKRIEHPLADIKRIEHVLADIKRIEHPLADIKLR